MDSIPHSGAQLARAFHRDAVAPLLRRELPGLRYTAGRLGSGSDVLGLDDAMSRDHDWGCRLTLLVDAADRPVLPRLADVLCQGLPERYQGLPVAFSTTWDGTVSHRVGASTVAEFAVSRLGVDPLAGLSTVDWLVLTGQSVLEVTGGPVFLDGTGEWSLVRRALRWYPPDVERYVLGAGWQRLAQQFPLMGRTGQRGQELGSRIIAATLAEDLVRLAFLLHRRWAPYRKWREAMFASLPGAGDLAGPLAQLVSASGWRDRESAAVAAAEALLRVQRERGLPTPEVAITPFFDRPYRTVDPAVPAALLAAVTDPGIRALPPGVGSVEQWVDSVDVLTHAQRRAALADAYRSWSPGGGD